MPSEPARVKAITLLLQASDKVAEAAEQASAVTPHPLNIASECYAMSVLIKCMADRLTK